MSSKMSTARIALIGIIRNQKLRAEKALNYYQELAARLPEDEMIKMEEDTPFYPNLNGSLPLERHSPIYILCTAIKSYEEFLEALDNFTNDQFSAFLMGLGLSWIPITYWGVTELNEYKEKLDKAILYYDELKEKLPDDCLHEVEVRGVIDALPRLAVPSSHWPADLARLIKPVVEGMIDAFEDHPF